VKTSHFQSALTLSLAVILVAGGLTCLSQAQQAQAQPKQTQQTAVVPTLVNFSGTLTDLNGKPLAGTVGVTFLLYKDEQGGAPLWLETQNVTPDENGHYSAMLGSTRPEGLPTDVFVSGEARWLAVEVQGQTPLPRVLLLSVPYALKAGDAETVGGLPASAFVLAAPVASGATPSSAGPASSAMAPPPATSNVTTTGGTVNAIPLFSTATNIQNSILTQTATTAINVVGKLNLPSNGTATATGGKGSRPMDFVSSAFNSGTAAAAPQTFQLQAEAAANNTVAPSGTLNLLFASGTTAPAETGFKISSKGLITFATGQTFPGTGKGTITGVTAGTGLTGGGTTGAVTLNVDTTKIPQLGSANSFSQTMSVNVSNPLIGALNATSAYQAIVGTMTSNDFFTAAITGNATASGTGTTIGVMGNASTSSGYGVYGSGNGAGVYGVGGSAGVYGTTSSSGSSVNGVQGATENATAVRGDDSGNGQGVVGTSAGTGYGVYGSSQSGTGVYGISNSLAGRGVSGANSTTGGVGVYGSDTTGFGFATDSNVTQALGMGGWVKAMVYVQVLSASGGPGAGIVRCFNSQLSGSGQSTPPCGLTYTKDAVGDYNVDFGFEVDNRFPTFTLETAGGGIASLCRGNCFLNPTSHQLDLVVCVGQNPCTTSEVTAFYLFVY